VKDCDFKVFAARRRTAKAVAALRVPARRDAAFADR